MSIFVSVASYRDPQLVPTIENLIKNSDNPDSLHFGIVNQDLLNKHPDLSYLNNVKQVKIHARDAKGAGYARKLASELYDGQDYFLQIDAHMRFAKGWDTKLISMYNWCANDAGTDKVILSQFPAPFEVFTDGSINYIHGDEHFWEEPSWTSVVRTYYGAWAGNREKIDNFSVPHKSHTVLGAWLFSRGKIATDIPYDERISFMGEELCFAIRAYTRGYEIYAPNEMLCWHFYKRPNTPKVWGDKKTAWYGIENYSKEIQKSVLIGEEQGIYGIADLDRYEQYQKMIGINFREFYEMPEEKKIDLDFVSEELTFDQEYPNPMSGSCIKNQHQHCLVDVCVCNCHKEK